MYKKRSYKEWVKRLGDTSFKQGFGETSEVIRGRGKSINEGRDTVKTRKKDNYILPM